jgi:hypothetical protein
MQLYNSSSFGRRERRGSRRGGADYYVHVPDDIVPQPAALVQYAPVHHAPVAHHAPAAPRAPRVAKPTINFRDTESGEDAIMMADEPIRTHLAANKNDNITILWAVGASYRAANSRRTDFTRLGNGLYVYECRPGVGATEGGYGPHNVFTNKRLWDLTKAGIPIGGYADSSKPFLAKHQVYLLHPTRMIEKAANHVVAHGGLGGHHCQPGSSGQLYELRPVKLKKGGAAAFGRGSLRTRRRRRSSSFGRRTRNRRR